MHMPDPSSASGAWAREFAALPSEQLPAWTPHTPRPFTALQHIDTVWQPVDGKKENGVAGAAYEKCFQF